MNWFAYSPGMTIENVEECLIKGALHHHRGNKTAAAGAIGCAIRTLDAKLEKYQQEEKAGNDRAKELRKREEDYIRRARGQNSQLTVEAPRDEVSSRVSVESALKAQSKHNVSVSQREKVQEVLPPADPPRGPGRPRKAV